MLSRLVSDTWLEDPEKEVFIDRDRDRFSYVLDYLRHGEKIMIPETMSMDQFLKDLDFYGITITEGSVKKDSLLSRNYIELLKQIRDKKKHYEDAKRELEEKEKETSKEKDYSLLAIKMRYHFHEKVNGCELTLYKRSHMYEINEEMVNFSKFDESLLNKYLKKYGLKVTDWGNNPCTLKLV